MTRIALLVAAGCVCLLPALAQKSSPLEGRWDFNTGPQRANWLGITEKDGGLEVWFQPTGGNVRQVKDFKAEGAHLTFSVDRDTTWELDASAKDKLTGFQKHGADQVALTGVRAPELKRSAPAAWTNPEPLFNGKDLTGWEPLDPAQSHWTVDNGDLLNQAHGSNLKTTRKFDDFKLHVEFNCPDDSNSGIYLRGRYEVQLEYEPLTKNPPERRIGSVYGRIAPNPTVERSPGKWESFDITLVGRTVTIAHNGVLTVDHKEIEGITGGALDADEADPGVFYIQGDHTGGLRFRNITVSVPKR